jgi:RNA polymerase sigma-70 factor, ECF subfamily
MHELGNAGSFVEDENARATAQSGGRQMTESDILLVKRAQKGDIDAFESLYNQHLKRVYNIAWRMMGNDSDAQDIAQEVMLKAWRALPGFKLDSALGTWLYRITMNACSDELRRRKAKTVSVEEMSESGRELADAGFEDGAVDGQSIAWAVGQLNEEYRAVVVLRDIEGYTYEEIADILRCPIGTVRSRINRAREQLRNLLNKSGTFHAHHPSKIAERGRT